jgi:hypothetical protein
MKRGTKPPKELQNIMDALSDILRPGPMNRESRSKREREIATLWLTEVNAKGEVRRIAVHVKGDST